MNIQIDHVVIAGKDLDEMRAGFASVGLTPDEGGQHADGHTHNALIGFEDGSYLELIAPMPGGTAPGHVWSDYMNNNAGVCAWAIRSNDIRADVEMFRQRGITVGDPVQGGRNRPDGVRLEWITAKLGDGPLGSVLPFLIQDVTPRELRVPRTKSAEGLITGVEEVVIAIKDEIETSDLFRHLFLLSDIRKDANWEIGWSLTHLEGSPITLLQTGIHFPADRIEEIGESVLFVFLQTPNFHLADQQYGTFEDGYQDWFDRQIAWLEPGTPGAEYVGFIGDIE